MSVALVNGLIQCVYDELLCIIILLDHFLHACAMLFYLSFEYFLNHAEFIHVDFLVIKVSLEFSHLRTNLLEVIPPAHINLPCPFLNLLENGRSPIRLKQSKFQLKYSSFMLVHRLVLHLHDSPLDILHLVAYRMQYFVDTLAEARLQVEAF